MIKILVCVAGYPNNHGHVGLMYVHTRDCYYIKHGIDVTVLNFAASEDYEKDGIKVVTLDSYKEGNESYDMLLLHAANLRNHYRFLKKYEDRFQRMMFFFHGHEVLKINKAYSKPYSYVKRAGAIKRLGQDIYDTIKLAIWRKYFPKMAHKSHFVFVSQWMKDEFLKSTHIPERVLEGRSSIIYNSIASEFETLSFDEKSLKEYDFITVRSFLDGSKYGIDIVNRLAWNTPEKKFLVIGKGEFFKHTEKAPNLVWENAYLNHAEIATRLNTAKFALMPTRTDAQGLMMCEMAGFGIPVLTSDIPICHEIFGAFENVYYIDNNDLKYNLSSFDDRKSRCIKHKKYYAENTVKREVKQILYLCNI